MGVVPLISLQGCGGLLKKLEEIDRKKDAENEEEYCINDKKTGTISFCYDFNATCKFDQMQTYCMQNKEN